MGFMAKDDELEPGAFYEGNSGTVSLEASMAISMKRIADAFEQLVYFHLGPPRDEEK